jgi:cardiolipin synthase A/B
VRFAVASRKAAGVAVRAILADPGWIDANADAAKFLAANGIPAKYMADPGVHAKAMIADGARAYMGSENLSWTSLTKNREVGLLVYEGDAVKTIADTFEKDWASATPF